MAVMIMTIMKIILLQRPLFFFRASVIFTSVFTRLKNNYIRIKATGKLGKLMKQTNYNNHIKRFKITKLSERKTFQC